MSNVDLDDKDYIDLKNEVVVLRAAIRQHMNEKGHDRCWLDDQELYSVLPEGNQAQLDLPPKCEFLANCQAYWLDRQPNPVVKKESDSNRHFRMIGLAVGTSILGMFLTISLLMPLRIDLRDYPIVHFGIIIGWFGFGWWLATVINKD